MSDQPGRESFTNDIGSISLDDEDQLESEDTLVPGDEGGAEPWTPPDEQNRATEWGTTAEEEAEGESLEQRIMQEQPDPDSGYGAPEDHIREAGEEVDTEIEGPSDPNAIDDLDSSVDEVTDPALDDVGDPVGDAELDAEVGTDAVGELVSPDGDAMFDTTKDLVAREDGGLGEGPEQGAMHIER